MRKKPAQREIINDINGDLVNFFRVLQRNENLVQLLGRLCLSFNSEEMFQQRRELLASVPNILDEVYETAEMIRTFTPEDIDYAVAFYENQVFSFSSTGKSFAIAKKDMTVRFPRLLAACSRLREAIIMHRDYKDVINYAAGPGGFILMDPPYRGTEGMYPKSNFGVNEHVNLFDFMGYIDKKHGGQCKILITYNNDPYIKSLADHHGFDTFVQKRLHNMAQSTKPGAMFEELLIANYDLKEQANKNHFYYPQNCKQLGLFE